MRARNVDQLVSVARSTRAISGGRASSGEGAAPVARSYVVGNPRQSDEGRTARRDADRQPGRKIGHRAQSAGEKRQERRPQRGDEQLGEKPPRVDVMVQHRLPRLAGEDPLARFEERERAQLHDDE